MSSSSTLDRRLLVGTVEEEERLVVVELGFWSGNDGEDDGDERWRGEWPGDNNMVDKVISMETRMSGKAKMNIIEKNLLGNNTMLAATEL